MVTVVLFIRVDANTLKESVGSVRDQNYDRSQVKLKQTSSEASWCKSEAMETGHVSEKCKKYDIVVCKGVVPKMPL